MMSITLSPRQCKKPKCTYVCLPRNCWKMRKCDDKKLSLSFHLKFFLFSTSSVLVINEGDGGGGRENQHLIIQQWLSYTLFILCNGKLLNKILIFIFTSLCFSLYFFSFSFCFIIFFCLFCFVLLNYEISSSISFPSPSNVFSRLFSFMISQKK